MSAMAHLNSTISGWVFGLQGSVQIPPAPLNQHLPQSQIWPANPFRDLKASPHVSRITVPFAIMIGQENNNGQVAVTHDMQLAGRRAPQQAVVGSPQKGHQLNHRVNELADEVNKESLEGNHNSRRVRNRITSHDPVQYMGNFNRADKPQKPRDITQKSLQDARNNPESPDLGRQLGYVLSFVRVWGHKDEYGPMSVLQYVKDMAAKNFLDPLLRDLRNGFMMMPMSADHTPEDLHDPWSNTPAEKRVITALQQRVTGAVRSGEVIALQDLHEGRVKQAGSESVAAYTQRFMERVRMLPRESQSNLCMFFLSGLKPGLRVKCALDRDNHRWSDLMALTQYAYSEEERMVLTHSLFPHYRYSRPSRARVSSPSKREAWTVAVAAMNSLEEEYDEEEGLHITDSSSDDVLLSNPMYDATPLAVAVAPKKRARREWKHKGKDHTRNMFF